MWKMCVPTNDYTVNDYSFPGKGYGRRKMRLNLQFSKLINRMEPGNQLPSFQSPTPEAL